MTTARSPVAFGPYLITRRIARGGMAEIYRARSRTPSRWVALKMMRSSLGHEELRSRLFEREARIAEKLTHENVIPLYEHGTEVGRPYLAMEYLRGRDLSHLLKDDKTGREQIPLELGLYIGFKAAAGLGHAHALADPDTGQSYGIVHRDVSPGNVMIGYDGSVKVLDFGVARINETQGVHTQTGTLRGKFAYMSPEQTLGEEIDARSDVFSFGTVLYELLTGVNCFRAQNPIATLERVQSLRPVPPSRANRQIPKEVDRILARCLAKDRQRRYRDGRTLSDAIGEYLSKIGLLDRGQGLLAQHMCEAFAWEKHEEESELAREEEEVALYDVVEFSVLPEEGLDARNVAVSQEEEASQSEVKNVALHRDGAAAEEEVFEGEGARTSGPNQLPISSPSVPISGPTQRPVAPFFDTDPTATQPRPAESLRTARIVVGQPTAQPISESEANVTNPLAARAGIVTTPGLGVDAPISATVMRGAEPSPGRGLRVLLGTAAVLVVVIGVALVVTRDVKESAAPPAPIDPRPKVMEPVTITLPPPDAAPKAPEPKPAEAPALRLEPVAVAMRPAPHPTPPPSSAPEARAPKPAAPSAPAPPRKKAPTPPPASAPIGFLNVGAKPWAEIKIDGKAWPYQTPQAGIELPAGKHTLVLSNKETGVTKSTVVYIKAGAYRTVTMDLRK